MTVLGSLNFFSKVFFMTSIKFIPLALLQVMCGSGVPAAIQSRNTVFNLTTSAFSGSITHLGGTKRNKVYILLAYFKTVMKITISISGHMFILALFEESGDIVISPSVRPYVRL